MTATIFDKRGRVLSVGKNSYSKTHPIQARHASRLGMADKVFTHAEISALTKCKNFKKSYRIVVTKVTRLGEVLPVKSCAICVDAIKTFAPHLIIENNL